MKYIIMCGGNYKLWDLPRPLQKVNNETLVERTIRLLQHNNITNIVISSNDERYDNFGVIREENPNNILQVNKNAKTTQGYWLDAFLPSDEPCTYLYGDVYYSYNAIAEIVQEGTVKNNINILFGSNKRLRGWEEPFAYVVKDTKSFFNGIKAVKQLFDKGKCNRHPITWELYRYLNNIDVNKHILKEQTYRIIDDITQDIDKPKDKEVLEKMIEKPILSIIIPCYNVEPYIQECLDSLPVRDDIEIICIDDCSTDNTYSILKNNNQITTLLHNQVNEGVAYSRNLCIDKVNGTHLMFIDSDDYVNTSALNTLIDKLYNFNYDIIHYDGHITPGGYHHYWKDGRINGTISGGMFRIFKRSFLGKYRFPLLKQKEDGILFHYLDTTTKNTLHYKEIIYYYRYPRDGGAAEAFHQCKTENERKQMQKIKDDMHLFLVENTGRYNKENVVDVELGYIPKPHEQWIVTKDRLDALMSDIKHGPYVYLIKRQPKVILSIIIPVYNQGKLISKCLNSIPNNENIEIIVINDGSTDNTAKELQKYKNIKLITNDKNYGQSYSRNKGLDIAQGKYIMFLDSDDTILSFHNFEKMLNILKGATSDFIYYKLKTNDGTIIDAKKDSNIKGFLKIFKRSIIGNVRLPLVSKGEDIIFHDWLMCRTPQISHSDITLVNYNYPRDNSVTTTPRHEIKTLKDKKFIVAASPMYEAYHIQDTELKCIPKPGKQWTVTKDRLDTLTWNNNFEFPLVYIVKEVE